MKIETVPLASLKPDPRNARKRGDANLKAIRDSLRHHGQVEPLVVQKSTGLVIGGNGRLAAMKALGWKEAKVYRLDLDGPRARALAIALNRTAETAEWDFKALADTLAEIDTGEFDVAELTGFDKEELERIANWAPEQTDEEITTLSERFGIPPFSVLDARQGYWQDRKRQWLSLGFRSELGRGGGGREVDHVGDDPAVEAIGRPGRKPSGGGASPGGSPRPAMKLRGGRTVRGDGRGRELKP